MLLIRLIYDLIAIPCIIFVIFHPMDFFSWIWVKGKAGAIWLYNWLKGFTK